MSLKDLDHLGAALAVLRRRSGKMQKDISEETGMSRSQVSRYERGRDTPNLVTLVRYLSTINSDFRDLHDAIQDVKSSNSISDTDRPTRLALFERALMYRLPFAPELRVALYELLEPIFVEMDAVQTTLAELRGESYLAADDDLESNELEVAAPDGD